jgi:hypothetical protein
MNEKVERGFVKVLRVERMSEACVCRQKGIMNENSESKVLRKGKEER